MSLQILTYKHFFIKAPIVSLSGQPSILFDGKQANLLEALEYKKVKVFSECRNGFCGACKTKIISGKVSYLTEPLVELEQDECLPCCCIPQTDVDLELAPISNSIHRVKNDSSSTSPSTTHLYPEKV
ncbi:class I ribonucleotide reductase maintenance protein YfaE [Shewanella gaetbuli]|uniref:class I ribonucleotide reductase maintenance protein YfaE n=1 Tax=Shewanella gaetbuli TaxID=220752 RepID=UPI003B82FC74